jgi:hypothetical protein
MRRSIRTLLFVTASATVAACSSPTAPSAPAACLDAKIPYAACPNKDYINPLGDYINPLGDYINPLGNVVNPTD